MTEPARDAALVTGGARRIGRQIALTLAGAGFDVAVHHRASPDEAAEVAAAIEASGRRAAIVQADLADETAVRALTAQAAAALGPLTVLGNNASVFLDDRVGALGRETWDAHLEVNLRAPLVLAEAFAAQAPDGSCIVNLLDQRVLRPNPQFFSYAVSKAGLWFATRTLAQALAPRIRVNGVGPGPTLPSIHQSPAQFEAEATHTPLGRRATPRDIAAAVLYLIDAPGVTGQMIAVDGGQHLAWRTPDIVEQGL